MDKLNVKIKLLREECKPIYKRQGDVCMDCYANIALGRIEVPKHTRCLVGLGFCLELPEGYECVVRPRSGNTLKGVDIGIGTVDMGYRGEVKACVINNTDDDFPIKDLDRIAQIAVRPAPVIEWDVTDTLSDTERGSNGFGSSGI